MFVILWIKEIKYYAYTKENHWTDNIQAAGKFNTLEAAQKYAKNALKDKLHELQYLTLDGKEVSEDPIPTLTKEEAEAAYEELRQAVEIFGKAAEKIPAITNIMLLYNLSRIGCKKICSISLSLPLLEISFSSNWDVCLRLAESREERLKIVLVI